MLGLCLLLSWWLLRGPVYVMWWIKKEIRHVWQLVILLLLWLLDVVIWYMTMDRGTYRGEYWWKNWGECCSTPFIVGYWVKGGVVEPNWLIWW